MPEPTPDTRLIALATLGERLAPLRPCDATALAAVRGSLERYGQLTAITLFVENDQLEILDGFKRVRAARALGCTTLLARIDDVDAIEAKLRVAELPRSTRPHGARGGLARSFALSRRRPRTTRDRAAHEPAQELGLAT